MSDLPGPYWKVPARSIQALRFRVLMYPRIFPTSLRWSQFRDATEISPQLSSPSPLPLEITTERIAIY
jgi:hypothetical protein